MVVVLKQLRFLKEQSPKHARKHIKRGCYLKVTLAYRGLIKGITTEYLLNRWACRCR